MKKGYEYATIDVDGVKTHYIEAGEGGHFRFGALGRNWLVG
jgi:hypothetical protein